MPFRFVASYLGRRTIDTESLTFVLQSKADALKAVASPSDPDRAAKLVAMLGAIEGKKSDGFVGLLKRLRAAMNN